MVGESIDVTHRPAHARERPQQAEESKEPEATEPAHRRDTTDEIDPVAADVGSTRRRGPQPRGELDDEDTRDQPLDHEDGGLVQTAGSERDEGEANEYDGNAGEGKLPSNLVALDECSIAILGGSARGRELSVMGHRARVVDRSGAVGP